MGSIRAKIEYLEATKKAIRDAIVAKGVAVADTDTFRSYADKIDSIKGTSHTTPTNTYEKGTLAGKVAYLLDTKEAIRRAITAAGVEVSTTAKFRDYANKISQIESPIISFTIDSISYSADTGMTWGEWVESDYSGGTFEIDSYNEVKKIGTSTAIAYRETPQSDYTFVHSDDIIVVRDYSLRK